MNPVGLHGGAERRSDRRYKVRFRLHWGPWESVEYKAEVTDLSAGGCFVESGEALNEGGLVKLRLDIPATGTYRSGGTSSSG
jgi:hypothetical protein